MNFLELKVQLENKLEKNSQFELLELNYIPFAFGSGFVAYRISGRNIKVIYDGRENQVQCHISLKHDKNTNAVWSTIFTGTPTEFIDRGIAKLLLSI